jgi:hypothetical protein
MPDRYLGICYLLGYASRVAHFILVIDGESAALLVRFDFRRPLHREHLLELSQLRLSLPVLKLHFFSARFVPLDFGASNGIHVLGNVWLFVGLAPLFARPGRDYAV